MPKSSVPICDDCQQQALLKREPARNCPIDGKQMRKIARHGIVVDQCLHCGGVWLDKGELQLIIDEVRKHAGQSDSSEFWSGFLIGVFVG